MASIVRRSGKWRVHLYRGGQRQSATFSTKQQAAAWATLREAELGGEKLPDHTLRDALRRYAREECPKHKGCRWELVRLAALERDELASVRLPLLKANHLSDWKLRRLEKVSGASVARELTLLKSVLSIAKAEWRWIHYNPADDVKKPASPPSRKRRISQDEIDRITAALGIDELRADTASQRTGLAFLFALETAMRAGEITGLTWADVRPKSVRLPDTKNGDTREVPLSPAAREIISVLPRGEGPIFALDPQLRDALFRKARGRAKINNLHFHDTRAEAIWRLSKKLDVMELARAIGHRDLRSLLIYYQTSADELADRLG